MNVWLGLGPENVAFSGHHSFWSQTFSRSKPHRAPLLRNNVSESRDDPKTAQLPKGHIVTVRPISDGSDTKLHPTLKQVHNNRLNLWNMEGLLTSRKWAETAASSPKSTFKTVSLTKPPKSLAPTMVSAKCAYTEKEEFAFPTISCELPHRGQMV